MNLKKEYEEQISFLEKKADISFKYLYDKHQDIFIDIFLNKKLNDDTENKDELNILGLYYCYILEDCDKAVIMWLFAIGFGSVDALVNLGNYYLDIGNNEGR